MIFVPKPDSYVLQGWKIEVEVLEQDQDSSTNKDQSQTVRHRYITLPAIHDTPTLVVQSKFKGQNLGI